MDMKPKVKVLTWLEFELATTMSQMQPFTRYNMGTFIPCGFLFERKIRLAWDKDIESYFAIWM